MPQKIKIFNGKVITPSGVIARGSVLLDGSKIVAVKEGNIDIADVLEMDAGGQYISPGFVDIHIHGGGGCDFMDNTEDAFLKIAETHAQYGTTSMVPTTLTSEREDLIETLEVYERANKRNLSGAQFLGMHLEGPYFSINQRGAQDERYIRKPDPAEYEDIVSRFKSIKRWSAAPELEGAIRFGKHLRANGIIAAIAHTDAIYEEVLEAFESGYSLITHLYSAMSGVTRRNAFRYAGVIESAYLIDELDVEIIADGVHLPAPLLKLVYKIKGPDRIALITDSMRGAGMPEGKSVLGNMKSGLNVIIEDGVAKLPDRTAFAGSVATADRLVRNMVKLADVSVADAVKMMTATPARIMGAEQTKGSLEVGKDADIVIFDQDINVGTVIIGGRTAHNNQKHTATDLLVK